MSEQKQKIIVSRQQWQQACDALKYSKGTDLLIVIEEHSITLALGDKIRVIQRTDKES